MKWLSLLLAASAAFYAGLAAAPASSDAPADPARPGPAGPRKVKVFTPEGRPLRARVEARTATKVILAETDEQGCVALPLEPGDVVVIEVVAPGFVPATRGPVIWDEALRTFELR